MQSLSIDDDNVRDEIIAVHSIFGEDVVTISERNVFNVEFPRIGASPSITIRVVLPDTYPRCTPPVVEIQSMVMDVSMVEMMVRRLEDDMFVPGEEVCFEWLSWVKDEFELCTAGRETLSAVVVEPQQLKQQDDEEKEEVCAQVKDPEISVPPRDIFHGEVSEQKKSTFQGHVARVSSLEDVQEVMQCLLQHSKIQHATHNIMAYRLYTEKNGTTMLLQDCDDDGEAAAGKRLLHLLQVMDVQGLVVVVSRWYGGIHLGPARFQCINNAGRTAIEGFMREEEQGNVQCAREDAAAGPLKNKKKKKKNPK